MSRSREHNKCKIHLLGDYNLDLLKFAIHKPTEEFIDSMYASGLIPTITKPTRLQGTSATLIDNIFSSSVGIGLAGVILNDISDHNMVFAIEDIATDCPESKVKRPDMSSKNITAFCDLLTKSNWDFIQEENDITKAYDYFYEKINATAEISFPLKVVKVAKSFKVPWMTPGLIKSKKIKNKLLNKKIKIPTVDNINKYKQYKNLYNKVCRRAKFDHTKQVYTEHKNDAKKLWSLINSSIGRKTKKGADIPNFFKDNNVIFDNYKDIAEGFNNVFYQHRS